MNIPIESFKHIGKVTLTYYNLMQESKKKRKLFKCLKDLYLFIECVERMGKK